MSHWLYIHREISGVKGVWKIGITIHPSNAVRGRQRVVWSQLRLDHLYFGLPADIKNLELAIKNKFKNKSGKALLPYGTQTELIKENISEILDFVKNYIANEGLSVLKLPLKKPYFGTNANNCDLQLESEEYALGNLVHTPLIFLA